MLIEPIQTVWIKEQCSNENYLTTNTSMNRDVECEWNDIG